MLKQRPALCNNNSKMTVYYTYVLKSLKDGNLYIGYTNDLRERLKNHKNGEVHSTKNRRPLILMYFEGCFDKESAIKREKYLKTTYGHRYLKNRFPSDKGMDL